MRDGPLIVYWHLIDQLSDNDAAVVLGTHRPIPDMEGLFYQGLARLHIPLSLWPRLVFWAGIADALNVEREEFDVEVTRENLGWLSVRGYFDPHSYTVVNATYDVSVLFHEYGHALRVTKVLNRSGGLDEEVAANLFMAGAMHALNLPLHPGFHMLSNNHLSRLAYAAARYRCGGRLDTCTDFWRALQEGEYNFFSTENIFSHHPLRDPKKTAQLLNCYMNEP